MPRLAAGRTVCFASVSIALLLATLPPDYREIAPFSIPSVGPLAEFVAHACIFVVIGAAATAWPTGRGWLGAWAAALRISLPLILLTELYQVLRPAQHEPLVSDMLAHLLGALTGASLAWRFRATLRRLRDGYATHERLAYAIGLAVASCLLVALQFVPTLSMSSLRGWDRDFPLLIGNEVGGERPWLGEVAHVAIYDRTLSPQAIRELSVSRESAESRAATAPTPLVAYDFSGGAVEMRSTADPFTALTLNLEDPEAIEWVGGEGLWLRRATTLSTNRPAGPLSDALAASGAFSVEVVVRPANLTQGGPARIVSVSGGPLVRNFTLGQRGAGLEFRVRSPIAGPSGTRRMLRTGRLSNGRLQHVVATYDRGASRLFIDGEEQQQVLGMPDLQSLERGAFTLVFFCALLFAICGVGAFAATGPIAGPSVLGAVFLCASILSWLVRARVLGQSPDFETGLVAAVTVSVLYPVIRRVCGSPHARLG
jgi:hypothetical protein